MQCGEFTVPARTQWFARHREAEHLNMRGAGLTKGTGFSVDDIRDMISGQRVLMEVKYKGNGWAL